MGKTLRSFIASALLALSCITPETSLAENKHDFPLRRTDSSGFFDTRLRFSVGTEYNMAKLTEGKTLYPYSGQVTLKAADGWGSTVWAPGIEGVFNISKNLELTAGLDLQLDFAYGSTGEERKMGMYEDIKGVKNGKTEIIAYDKLNPELFSLYPFIGINVKFKYFQVGLEASIPFYKEFEREWYYYNSTGQDITESQRYGAEGSKFTLRVSSREYEHFSVGGFFSTEDYKLERANKPEGSVRQNSFGIEIKKRF